METLISPGACRLLGTHGSEFSQDTGTSQPSEGVALIIKKELWEGSGWWEAGANMNRILGLRPPWKGSFPKAGVQASWRFMIAAPRWQRPWLLPRGAHAGHTCQDAGEREGGLLQVEHQEGHSKVVTRPRTGFKVAAGHAGWRTAGAMPTGFLPPERRLQKEQEDAQQLSRRVPPAPSTDDAEHRDLAQKAPEPRPARARACRGIHSPDAAAMDCGPANYLHGATSGLLPVIA